MDLNVKEKNVVGTLVRMNGVFLTDDEGEFEMFAKFLAHDLIRLAQDPDGILVKPTEKAVKLALDTGLVIPSHKGFLQPEVGS